MFVGVKPRTSVRTFQFRKLACQGEERKTTDFSLLIAPSGEFSLFFLFLNSFQSFCGDGNDVGRLAVGRIESSFDFDLAEMFQFLAVGFDGAVASVNFSFQRGIRSRFFFY